MMYLLTKQIIFTFQCYVQFDVFNASFQDVKRLFFLAYVITDDENDEAGIKSNKELFPPRGEINNYNVLIDG